jgi:acyl-CoA synthetase (AMP-forming)/AMP-acid ligase II
MNIGSLLRQSAERYPEHVALVHKDRRWTYAAWYARVRRFAQALADRGVGRGDRVAFFVGTSEYSATTYFATQLLGAVAVPVNFRLAAGELSDILRDSGARTLVYGEPLRDKVERSRELLAGVSEFISCSGTTADVAEGHLHFETRKGPPIEGSFTTHQLTINSPRSSIRPARPDAPKVCFTHSETTLLSR